MKLLMGVSNADERRAWVGVSMNENSHVTLYSSMLFKFFKKLHIPVLLLGVVV